MRTALDAPVSRRAAAAVTVIGVAALTLRGLGPGALVITLAVGVLAGTVRLRESTGARLAWPVVVLAGVAAFAAVRGWVQIVQLSVTAFGLLASMLAALAEEALFRRAAYAWLERWGVPLAIVVSAALFAIVHIPLYGPSSIPIDFGAGLLFGWQRWASGTWSAPAVTHVVANLLAYA